MRSTHIIVEEHLGNFLSSKRDNYSKNATM